MPGRLYALARYPALRRAAGPGDHVRGELYRLRTPEPTLRVLDAYEAARYRRVLRRATLGPEKNVRAWVYEWTTALPEHRRIEAW
jgi:gamma-glutamylcyclotransferase (GGCT)/AIG2-like uncharacterized protein YtfP